jgi:hypothetical protein
MSEAASARAFSHSNSLHPPLFSRSSVRGVLPWQERAVVPEPSVTVGRILGMFAGVSCWNRVRRTCHFHQIEDDAWPNTFHVFGGPHESRASPRRGRRVRRESHIPIGRVFETTLPVTVRYGPSSTLLKPKIEGGNTVDSSRSPPHREVREHVVSEFVAIRPGGEWWLIS